MSFGNTKSPTKSDKPAKYPVPMRLQNGKMGYCLEGELKEKFCKLYRIHSNRRIIEWFGMGFSTVHRFAKKFGLEKDMAAVRREQARDTKRICEQNGWYASIRGKAPTQACIDASKRKRATGWNPIKQLKEESPRRYKAYLKKKSKERSDMWRKEYAREFYGMKRTNNLRLKNLSRKAVNQKYIMKHDCNYFTDPDHITWICYDSETTRSAIREATAIRYGLEVVEGEG